MFRRTLTIFIVSIINIIFSNCFAQNIQLSKIQRNLNRIVNSTDSVNLNFTMIIENTQNIEIDSVKYIFKKNNKGLSIVINKNIFNILSDNKSIFVDKQNKVIIYSIDTLLVTKSTLNVFQEIINTCKSENLTINTGNESNSLNIVSNTSLNKIKFKWFNENEINYIQTNKSTNNQNFTLIIEYINNEIIQESEKMSHYITIVNGNPTLTELYKDYRLSILSK